LALWRTEPVVVESPLPVDEACQRMREGLTSPWRWRIMPSFDPPKRFVIGQVRPGRVVVTATSPAQRNSWRYQVRGEVRPSAGGSVLVGRLGWEPGTRAFCLVWLGLCLTFLGTSIAAGVWPFALGCVGMLLFFCCLVWFAARTGRRDSDYLLAWLDERLRPAPPSP
jgi:hypothetical protein